MHKQISKQRFTKKSNFDYFIMKKYIIYILLIFVLDFL